MRRAVSYGLSLIGTMLVLCVDSWGSEPLPQLSASSQIHFAPHMILDTVPVKPATPVQGEAPTEEVTETAVRPVVKEVPKSRKKLKPAAVVPAVNVPPAKIVKPKIVIRKINVKVL